jgi:isoleucyl-tRNA synthetase
MVAPKAAGEYDSVRLEESIIKRWQKERTFARSIEYRSEGEPFIFLEGPPTANGRPGIHHVVARAYKDLVCRWKTMEGHLVERKGGWDTHGLPVEIEVQKRLDLMSNDAILEFGMDKFNEECKKSVWTYEDAWRKMSERMAFWVDLDNPYVTLDNNFIESSWWALKQMFEKDLLYRGYKVLPYCPQTGTSYSSHEVALGYKEVEEPSVYVKFKLENDDASILAWTTTPWTLPGNVGLAVGPDVTYCRVRISDPPGKSWEGRGGADIGEELILAKDLLKEVMRHKVEVISEFPGSELVGKAYEPLFPNAVERGESKTAWTVVSADFVTTSDGTGVVHTAVMYGEDDYNLGREVGFPEVHTVGMDGAFVEGVHPELDGKYVKDCDDIIINNLTDSNKLYREKMYLHDYPHCWRTGHPLLYYGMESWFVRMTAVKEKLLEFNDQVEWAPDWVGEGRFGEWLRNVKDWAISRERFWGTPLPVWRSEDGDMKCIGSIEELQKEVEKANSSGIENPVCPDDVDLHRPIVDDFVLISESGSVMRREPFVMDCWFDSGCAFFAQWHYPFENEDKITDAFPIDYICEGVDQTRGWFYTLLAVSTTVFDSICYKRCLSLGLILDKDGKKMSKSKGNVVDPWDHFNKEGADSSRWYMVTAGAPWNPLKFDPDGVRETYAKFFLTLWNVYKFHADYAALDGFDPEENSMPVDKRSELDRWILSKASTVAKQYHDQFVNWDFHKACRDLEDFVINDFSNWYVRRSRRRLWDEATNDDKRSCQHTLHEVLSLVCKLTAPVAPFMVDEIYSNLNGDSVHLSNWPIQEEGALPPQDLELESRMELVRSLAETGRRIRVKAKRRQRLPCNEGWIVGGPDLDVFHEILAEELNVEKISTVNDLDKFQQIELSPNRKMLGKKCRQDLPSVLEAISSSDPESTWQEIQSGTCKLAGYEITAEDIELRRVERSGFAAETIKFSENDEDLDVSLVLDMQISPELASKGLARDIIRRIQQKRKDLELDIEENIELTVWLDQGNPELLENDWAHLQNETRAGNATLELGPGSDDSEEFEVDDCKIYFKVN